MADPFAGPGEMRARCRALDWAATPLGPVEAWPPHLRTAVDVVLAGGFAMALHYGPEAIHVYNDACAASLGPRHPGALGRSVFEVFPESRAVIEAAHARVRRGETVMLADEALPATEGDGARDVRFTLSYAPLRDERGAVAGALVTGIETTARVHAEAALWMSEVRQAFLLRLEDRLRPLADPDAIQYEAARALGEHLRADRVGYAEAEPDDEHIVVTRNYTRGVPGIEGRHRYDDYGPALLREFRTGRTVVRPDIARDPSLTAAERAAHAALQLGATVNVPLVKGGRLVAVLFVHHRDAHAYTAEELALAEAVAARTWDAVERARAEAALRRGETRLRLALDVAELGTWEFSLLDGTGDLDPRAAEIVGLPPGEFPDVARAQMAAVHPDDLDALQAAVAAGVARGGDFDLAYRVVRPDGGGVRHVASRARAITDDAGRPVRLVGTNRDVTAEREAEARLRASETRYRALFESIDTGFCVIEVLFDDAGRPVDYRFLETNPGFVRQTGLADAVGRTVRELVPGHEPHWFEIYGRVAATGEPARFDAPAAALDRWYEAYAVRIDEPGERHVAVLFDDVSGRKRADVERERLLAALEVERARLYDVFRRAPSFIVAFRGPDQVYEFVNEAYYQLVGHRAIIGKPLLEAIPEIRGQGFEEILERVRQTGEPWVGREAPVQLQRTPGAPIETRYLDMVFQPLTEVDGTRSGVVVHGSDITAQVLARREVERLLGESERARAEAEAARRDAEGANRAKSEFLAVMSHELRTPLNAIGGYAELLEMGIRGPVTGQQREDLARIQASQRHLLGLINEVLNYAKLESGAVRYDVTDVDVRDALAAAAVLVAPQASAKGLALEVAPCPPGLAVRADADKLRQILLNLLSNAVKFTERGGRVELSCAADGPRVRAAVRDSGIGIPADQLDRIFEPFVQVRSELTREAGGTGLGLAISRDLARGMKGDLTAESAVRAGSTFTLTLPRAGSA